MIIYNSLALSVFNNKFILSRRVSTYMLFRSMFTTRYATKAINMNMIRPGVHINGNSTRVNLHEATNLKTPQRYNPGQGYTCGKYNKDVRTATGMELPKHEATHMNIIDRETNYNVAVFSSCKNVEKGFVKFSEDNYKGNILPNGQPKEQWMCPFKTPRMHDEDIFDKDQAATDFANKNERKIDAMLFHSNTHKKIPVKRVHKDSNELYHENGQPIFDNNGNEIDY